MVAAADPNGRAQSPPKRRSTQGAMGITVVAVSGPRPGRSAPMFGVHDGAQEEQLFVGQHKRDLQFQIRTRFDAWDLRGLSMRLPFFPGSEPGDTVTVTASITPGYWTLSSHARSGDATATLPLTVGLGWVTMLPLPLSIYNDWIVLNAIWLALLIFPGAYWFARSARPMTLFFVGGMVAGTLALLPHTIGAAPTQLSEWIGTAIGVLLGAIFAFALRRRQAPVTTT